MHFLPHFHNKNQQTLDLRGPAKKGCFCYTVKMIQQLKCMIIWVISHLLTASWGTGPPAQRCLMTLAVKGEAELCSDPRYSQKQTVAILLCSDCFAKKLQHSGCLPPVLQHN